MQSGDMEPANGVAAALGIRVAIENIRGEVHRARVVHGVHAYRLQAVGLRDVLPCVPGPFPAGTGTAAEEVDNDLIVLRIEAESVLGNRRGASSVVRT